MRFKTARIAKSSQHISPLDDMLDRPAVVMLVKKVSRLLAILNIHPHLQPILRMTICVSNGADKKPFCCGRPSNSRTGTSFRS